MGFSLVSGKSARGISRLLSNHPIDPNQPHVSLQALVFSTNRPMSQPQQQLCTGAVEWPDTQLISAVANFFLEVSGILHQSSCDYSVSDHISGIQPPCYSAQSTNEVFVTPTAKACGAERWHQTRKLEEYPKIYVVINFCGKFPKIYLNWIKAQ